MNEYIYLTICEVLLDEYKKTNFSSFSSFCLSLGYSLSHNNLSSREKVCVIKVIELLDVIYSMNDETNGVYISNFLSFEASVLFKFQSCIMDTKKYFPIAFN